MAQVNMRGKTVFITGGSTGLGREFGKQLAAKGAHVTIFARREGPLEEARKEILAARIDDAQEINTVSLDATDASQVTTTFRAQPQIPDILYCNAGDSSRLGFCTDVSATDFDASMQNNYYTALYSAHAVFKMWLEDDEQKAAAEPSPSSSFPTKQKLRQIVFINSAAALFPFPGYVAYSPPKSAMRALADTLRMEALRLSSPHTTYTIHIAFPSSILTPAFLAEQAIKPALTKKIESSTGPVEDLHKKVISAEKAVGQIIRAVERGEFAIAEDCLDSSLCYANAVGTSPKRGWGVFDTVVGVLATAVVWPVYRWYFDGLAKKDNIWREGRK